MFGKFCNYRNAGIATVRYNHADGNSDSQRRPSALWRRTAVVKGGP